MALKTNNLLTLSVIIVNYNVKYFLEQCLSSVLKATKNLQSEIYVIDNNSTDSSRRFFEGRFNEVNFIWNKENLGFSKANNMGLEKAKGEYILFLNPDTIIPEDCFEKCLEFFEEHKDAGAIGVKMVDGSGKFLKESKRSFPSPLTSLFKLSGLTRLFPHSKTFAKYHLGNLDANKNNPVDVLAGAFMMVPKKIIDEIGSFDESFFMYGEDVDLSYRIQKAGYKNYYFAGTSILHFKGESTRKGSLNYVKLFYKAMSIFVKKHYGGGRAGIFNFFIQIAIFFRAIISAVAKFMKWIGMPVIDAGVILMSFWLVKYVWSMNVKKEVNYSLNMLIIAFPVFTLIFLAVSYFSGLYDNGYKQKRLNYSTSIAMLVLLSGYSLLPETLRFSRGILFFGCVLAFILMTLIRWLLVKWKIIEASGETGEYSQTVIVGTQKEFDEAQTLMFNAGMKERILGRVEANGTNETKAIGNFAQLDLLLKKYPVKEIIFCEGKLSFKEIIATLEIIPSHMRIKFHAANSSGIIGSDSKNVTGKILSSEKNIQLSKPVNKRNKKLVDVMISMLFILTFPVHFLTQKNSLFFFKNVFEVLLLKKTWVGYAMHSTILPEIKNGILTTTGVPEWLNTLPVESLQSSDKWYAAHYEVWYDVKIILRSYKFLGIKKPH